MPDDNVLVKQIAQYPRGTPALGDLFLFQQGGINGPYLSAAAADILGAFELGGVLRMAPWPEGGIAFNGALLSYQNSNFLFSEPVTAPSFSADSMFIGEQQVATQLWVADLFDNFTLNTVWSFNGRKGDIQLTTDDVRRAGAVPNVNPSFFGQVTAPTIWNYADASDLVATTQFVQCAIQSQVQRGCIVGSVNGRGGNVVLNAGDIDIALGTPGQYGHATTPPMGDASNKIATTMFVDNAIVDLQSWTIGQFETYQQIIALGYAPINSPQFTGIPTGPTAAPGTTSGQLATTAYVQAAIVASTTGVSSFNTRTGAVVLDTADITGAGGAPINSPAFTGTPTATTQALGNSTTALATTAFVANAVAQINAGVLSFNGRSGAVVLASADVTGVGGALLASPVFSGNPTAPTQNPGTNNTTLATTAFIANALASLPAPVTSFNGRTGAITFQGSDISAVGGALLASPAFTGVPTAPTATVGTDNNQIATTAFVISALGSVTAGVATFNGRSGAVTLVGTDITSAGGALLASPAFTGTPSAPTAATGTNSQQLATTAFVQAALAAAPGGVSSFNGRIGAITLQAADVSAVGGALTASPTFTGTPAGPTAAPGTNTTQLATTAYVMAAMAAAGGVNSFNGRAGAVTLTPADLVSVSGALLTVGAAPPTGAPATANSALWWDSTNGVLYLNYNDGNSTQWVAMGPPVAQATASYQAWSYITPGSTPTFTTPANSSASTVYKVRMVAAGGGGGGCGSGATSAAAGGGGGEYKEFLLTGIAASTAIALAIGAAGLPGSNTASTPGGTGGNTTMTIGGQTVVCNGGVGGGYGTASTLSTPAGAGGAGGATPAISGLTLLMDVAGQSGVMGTTTMSGFGGSSQLGHGGTQPTNGPNTSAPPTGYGGGGSGAYAVVATGSNTTQTGGIGAIFIERVWG